MINPAAAHSFQIPDSSQISVSAIIVNYNCRTTLVRCVSSILFSGGIDEILLADNGSTDDSMNLIEAFNDPRLTIIRFKRNVGLALARNICAARSKGRYLAFVDADTEVHREWLAEPISMLESDRTIGAVQCINLSQKDPSIITHAGIGTDGLYWNGLPIDAAGFLGPHRKILYPIGAGFVIRRDAWDAVNGFDSSFFVGHDDVDLGIRLWLAGFQVLCCNKAVVYHDGGALRSQRSVGDLFQYYAIRNLLLIWAKNVSSKTLARHVLPLVLPTLFLGIFASKATGILAIQSFLKDLPRVIVKRRTQQCSRKISDDEIMPLLQHALPSKIMSRAILKSFHHKYVSGGL